MITESLTHERSPELSGFSKGISAVLLFVSLDYFHHFPGIGKSAQILFGKNEIAAVLNLEDSPSRFDQLGINTQFFLQFLRQTDGPGFVVSHPAVRDFAAIHVL